jgi:predicted TIM-barrel fold metal-dependent hydrolase
MNESPRACARGPTDLPYGAEVEVLVIDDELTVEERAALLGPTWAFGQETAVHALRLIGSGLFDRHPRLQVILGHLGEGLPISMWRIDNRNAWVEGSRGHRAQHPIAYTSTATCT